MAQEAPACENANAGEVFVNFVHSVPLPSEVGQISSLPFNFTQETSAVRLWHSITFQINFKMHIIRSVFFLCIAVCFQTGYNFYKHNCYFIEWSPLRKKQTSATVLQVLVSQWKKLCFQIVVNILLFLCCWMKLMVWEMVLCIPLYINYHLDNTEPSFEPQLGIVQK